MNDTMVEQRRALSAKEVHEALKREGEEELSRSWRALAWSGLASGISMGLSLLAEGVLRQHLPETTWRPLVTKFGYTLGFVAVTFGRQQLYTETTLTALLPFLHHRTPAMAARVIRLWLVVLASNLLGAWVFVWAAAHDVSFSMTLQKTFRLIGTEAAHYDPAAALVRGIFGGWLIALMVWLLPSADATKLWVIVAVTYVLAAAGLTHVIAGSVEVLYLVNIGELSWGSYFMRYGLPVLIGNSIGGIVFVALLNHAQVASDSAPVFEPHGRK